MINSRKCSNWLNSYVRYCQDAESPDKFHQWMGVSLISSALQRKCCLNWGSLKFYPNFYIVLVSPPGRARKGIAMGVARSFIEKMNIPMASDTTSLQALIRRMSESTNTEESSEEGYFESHSSIIAFSPELATFLGFDNKDLVASLCNFYDCQNVYRYETIGRGVEEVIGVYLTLVGATTPSQIRDIMSTETIGMGLPSRMIFIFEEKIKRRIVCPFFPLTDEGKQLEEDLIYDLTQIRSMRGDFKVSKKFLAKWSDWYGNYPEECGFDPQHFSGYWERRPAHVMKLSMIFSACESNKMVMSLRHFEQALQLIQETERKMPNTFHLAGQYDKADNIQRIMGYIAHQGEVYLDELMQEFLMYISETDLDAILKALRTAKFIHAPTVKLGRTLIAHWPQDINLETIPNYVQKPNVVKKESKEVI